jgi:hypothetical protein
MPSPCDSCMNRRFGRTYRLHHQGDKNLRARNNVLPRTMHRLLVTASIFSSSRIPIMLMKEAISSSETWVLTRATWCNAPEGGVLHLLASPVMWYELSNASNLGFISDSVWPTGMFITFLRINLCSHYLLCSCFDAE